MVKQSLSKVSRSSGHKVLGNFVQVGDGLYSNDGDRVDLHRLLTKSSPNVILMPIVSNLMRASGLLHGGIAIVDQAKRPFQDCIVAVRLNGVAIIRRLRKRANMWVLITDDPREEEIIIRENDTVEKIGVITSSITFHQQ